MSLIEIYGNIQNQIKQESPPAWTQEAYRPPHSKYMLCWSCGGDTPCWGVPPVQTWERGIPHQLDGVPSCPDLGRGYPRPDLGSGTPHQLDGVAPPPRYELTDKLKILPFPILRMRAVINRIGTKRVYSVGVDVVIFRRGPVPWLVHPAQRKRGRTRTAASAPTACSVQPSAKKFSYLTFHSDMERSRSVKSHSQRRIIGWFLVAPAFVKWWTTETMVQAWHNADKHYLFNNKGCFH